MSDHLNLTDDEIISEGISALQIEAEAVGRLTATIGADFVRAVRMIADCKGKVILTGVGKSGIIGEKISATFSSTGVPSVFLHPTEGAHGDLGIVAKNDIVIALSKSGETTELVNLIPFLRNRGASLIAMVGSTNSTLARKSDVVLDCGVTREACPRNLVPAPTCSTTAALAMGDALAVALVRLRNFTPQDFASIHPGGSLGSRLNLRVSDLMHSGDRNPVTTPDAPALSVVEKLSDFRLGGLNVVDADGKLLGVITDGDVRRMLKLGARFFELNASAIMTANPITVSPESLADEAYKKMEYRSSQINVLPVVSDEGVCVGLIRLHDVVGGGKD